VVTTLAMTRKGAFPRTLPREGDADASPRKGFADEAVAGPCPASTTPPSPGHRTKSSYV
jgi:hypothetical protein